MRYSFDDISFGFTKTGRKLDEKLFKRDPGLSDAEWYRAARVLAQYLNQR